MTITRELKPKSSLEAKFFSDIDKNTPAWIKNKILLDISNEKSFDVTITRENLTSSNSAIDVEVDAKDLRLGLKAWFENYKKEGLVSTAGIRGLQNPLYPWDTRYPIHFLGIALATYGKAKVLLNNPTSQQRTIQKISAGEVRYNTKEYIQIIARVQAALGIRTFIPQNFEPLPIWLVSFLIFMYDLDGGEYVTSSHAISKKTATKDLNNQGSQYVPEESILFINKVEEFLNGVEQTGADTLKLSPLIDPNIDFNWLKSIGNGIPDYSSYLKTVLANANFIDLIKSNTDRIYVDCMGGSMHSTLVELFEGLHIARTFSFLHPQKDPFFHGIGKLVNISGALEDLGCDTTIMSYETDESDARLPVIETMKYSESLSGLREGSVVLMTDPDGDRLVTAQVEPIERLEFLKTNGISYFKLDSKKILAVYIPNQSFLMTFDYRRNLLLQSEVWEKYDWFIIKTTASSISWDIWAQRNAVKVINTPVGFKEIASILRKIENKTFSGHAAEITDVTGKKVALGINPRLLFAGEESGGEIFGPVEPIKSRMGRQALAMREKSAVEAIIISAAMTSMLRLSGKYLSDYLVDIMSVNKIWSKFDVRIDVKYYNENEPDIERLKKCKETGITKRTLNDMYFLSIAFALRDKKVSIDQVRCVLKESFGQLEFNNLENVYFVGDGTFLMFSDLALEIRPSGTDAINKAYTMSSSKPKAVKYATALGNFDGTRGPLHLQLIDENFYRDSKNRAFEELKSYQKEDSELV